jgi:hypothetical protein
VSSPWAACQRPGRRAPCRGGLGIERAALQQLGQRWHGLHRRSGAAPGRKRTASISAGSAAALAPRRPSISHDSRCSTRSAAGRAAPEVAAPETGVGERAETTPAVQRSQSETWPAARARTARRVPSSW